MADTLKGGPLDGAVLCSYGLKHGDQHIVVSEEVEEILEITCDKTRYRKENGWIAESVNG